MKEIVNCLQMKNFDAHTIHYAGIPALVLMERASLSVAEEIEKKCSLKDKILVVCGNGNNGGDGIAIARILFLRGFDAHIYFVGSPEKMTAETRAQFEIAEKYHVSFVNMPQWDEYTTIVDAVFGVGLTRTVEGHYADVIERMNQADAWKVAVDISSGIHGDNGQILGIAFRADLTVTFAYRKFGHCFYPGKMYSGKVIVSDIGIYDTERKENLSKHLENSDILRLPERVPYGNKGTFGKVLIVAGCPGMCGAAYLSAAAALQGGAGMVKVVTPEVNRIPIQTTLPEAMISCDFSEEENQKNLDWCDIIIIGPGIGISEESKEHVEWFLLHGASEQKTVILDADGLNLLALHPEWIPDLPEKLIVTPHLGEMQRLCGKSIAEIQRSMLAEAEKFARETGAVCVLKDACTVIADQDGNTFVNLSGSAGMATAGSGDVLTGIAAALCCMYLHKNKYLTDSDNSMPDLTTLAALAVYIHGKCGELAAAEFGEWSMTARDIIRKISCILQGKILQKKEDEI